MNYYFELGAAAALRDKSASHCPFPTGAKREGWLAGYHSVISPAPPGNPVAPHYRVSGASGSPQAEEAAALRLVEARLRYNERRFSSPGPMSTVSHSLIAAAFLPPDDNICVAL